MRRAGLRRAQHETIHCAESLLHLHAHSNDKTGIASDKQKEKRMHVLQPALTSAEQLLQEALCRWSSRCLKPHWRKSAVCCNAHCLQLLRRCSRLGTDYSFHAAGICSSAPDCSTYLPFGASSRGNGPFSLSHNSAIVTPFTVKSRRISSSAPVPSLTVMTTASSTQ